MPKEITVEQFARWTYDRDRAVGLFPGAWVKVRKDYLDEAEFYSKMSRADWPCGILLKAGCHAEDHPGCPTKDWRD